MKAHESRWRNARALGKDAFIGFGRVEGMRKRTAFGLHALIAATLVSTSAAPLASAQGQPATMEEMFKARATLIAQCPPVTRAANTDEMPIHVTAWGDAGPSVLFVHGGVQGGIGGGPSNFAGQQPLATQGWRLNLVDRPGFGLSPSRGPDDMEADAIWISRELGESSHLVGHSFGGAEALLAAARRPQAVRSLVLVEPALHHMLATDPESLRDPKVLAGLQMVSKLFVTARTPSEFATLFARDLGQGADGGENPSAAALSAHPEKAAVLGCALLQAHTASPVDMRQAAEIVAHHHIPVLVISGGYSPAQDATGEVLAKLLHGRHVIVRSPNHFVQLMNPGVFNETVADFMRTADEKHGMR
jgi:pimeloyl-ACP methyl ester carboxylesterase